MLEVSIRPADPNSSIDKSIFGTGKFFKEQSIKEKQNNIYQDIDEAIKKAPEEEK